MWVHGVLDQFVMMSADNAVDVVCWDCWCVLVITGVALRRSGCGGLVLDWGLAMIQRQLQHHATFV